MTIRWLRRPRLDISFGREPKILLLCGVPALMAYVAAMMGIGLLGLSDMLGEANRLQAGVLTLQLPAETSAARTEMALAVLRQTPGITGVHLVDPAETKRLLEPWLGPSVPLDQLPLPRLVDLRTDPDAAIDFAALRQKLTSVAPGAELEERPTEFDSRRADLRRASAVLSMALFLIAILGVKSLLFGIWGHLARHQHVIELLHRLGADDSDIAARFQIDALWFGLLGGAGGALAGALTLLVFGGAALSLRFGDWRVWAVTVGVALATGLIAMVAARVMVLRRLAHMP
jgi:cell division transport system permease protein